MGVQYVCGVPFSFGNKNFCSYSKKVSGWEMENFYQWFVGFSDGESNFSIVPIYGENGNKISKFNFRFTIGLHRDDKNVLVSIHNFLAVGNIKESGEECKFVVSDKEGIKKLISIFDKFNLNTTKYLDYLDFKEAFNLYHNRNGALTEELKDKLIKLKSGTNSNRISFNMPSNHIKITTYWLLGLVEGEGSFHIWRSDLIPVFAIGLTERQLPVLEKIKEFLIQNLGFDDYSIWKLNNTSAMGINTQKARNNSKSSVLFIIKDIRILQNYLIPFFDKINFLSKKAQDFKDFKIISRLVYYGAHKKEPIKSLVLKLSRILDQRAKKTESLNSSRSDEINNYVLNPYYITGFSDAESSFNIRISQNKNYSTGWLIELRYLIGLHQKDQPLLKLIQRSLGEIGIIRNTRNDLIEFRITSIKELAVIIDHFDKYPLITQKFADYILFKQAYELVKQKDHLTSEGVQKIVNIRASMNLGLSDNLKKAFPNTTPVSRPLVLDQEIKDPNWLAGFTGGEGSFMVQMQKSLTHKTGFGINLKFQITQHVRDIDLMNKIVQYLNCGSYKLRSNKLAGDFLVMKSFAADINEKIIPFFKEHSPQGVKSLDFSDFCKVAEIIKTNDHLTEKGLEQIKLIKSGMNSLRLSRSDSEGIDPSGGNAADQLSNYSGKIPAEFFSKDERDILVNAPPLIEHLWDGRLRDISSKRIIYQHESCVYKIIKPSGEVLTLLTLSESAKIIGVNVKTLSKYLDVEFADNRDYTALIKGHKIKRIRVYY